MFRLMEPSDLTAVEELWAAQWDEPADLAEKAVRRFAGEENTYLAEENGAVQALVLAVPVTLQGRRGCYLYGLCSRDDNAAAGLVDYACDQQIKKGAAFMVAVPAGAQQAAFYGSRGFARAFELRCLTRDHNYLLELRRAVAAGEMDIEEARAVRRKDALISYVGMNGVALADMSSSPSPLEPGDLVLLTSDGLVKALPEAEIAAVLLEQGTDLTACAGTLLHRALARGGPRQDNTSLVLLRQGPAPAEAGEA